MANSTDRLGRVKFCNWTGIYYWWL